jgi:hypothetical protein
VTGSPKLATQIVALSEAIFLAPSDSIYVRQLIPCPNLTAIRTDPFNLRGHGPDDGSAQNGLLPWARPCQNKPCDDEAYREGYEACSAGVGKRQLSNPHPERESRPEGVELSSSRIICISGIHGNLFDRRAPIFFCLDST